MYTYDKKHYTSNDEFKRETENSNNKVWNDATITSL